MFHESKLLWWNAQECELQICELMSSPNLSYRGTWHVLLCQTDLAAQIWPCLPSQPIALLRCRQVTVDLKWSGTAVWFCVPSRLSRFDTSRVRLLRLHKRKIGLLFQPRTCELTSAMNPFPGGKSRSQGFHRFPPARASSAIDLIVNVNSQDSRLPGGPTSPESVVTPPSCTLLPRLEGSQNEHARIHRMLIEIKLFSEEISRKFSTTAEADQPGRILL